MLLGSDFVYRPVGVLRPIRTSSVILREICVCGGVTEVCEIGGKMEKLIQVEVGI